MRPKDYVAKREQIKQGDEAWRAQRMQELRARDAKAASDDAKSVRCSRCCFARAPLHTGARNEAQVELSEQ